MLDEPPEKLETLFFAYGFKIGSNKVCWLIDDDWLTMDKWM